MNLPQKDDFIDIHIHDGSPSKGKFLLQSLMAHEEKEPARVDGIAYTFGIHPWFLNDDNFDRLIVSVQNMVDNPGIVALGEAGFDRLKGPSNDLQRKAFEAQVILSEKIKKPVVIHCVRAWDDLLFTHKKLKPAMPWLVHGFRGSFELANQLLLKGMYLSFWFDFIIRPGSADLIRKLPVDRIFLETDGADIDIISIYQKVSDDLGLDVEDFKAQIVNNFYDFFKVDTKDIQ
jgi:TatD DNase family protein